MISLHNTFILPIGAVLPTCRLGKTGENAMWIIRNAMFFNSRRDTINLCAQAGRVLGDIAVKALEEKKTITLKKEVIQ